MVEDLKWNISILLQQVKTKHILIS
jgi:hypothetical protein